MDAEKGIEHVSSASLREQIEVTQRELGEKIESLEDEVRSVASQVSDTVYERISQVRDVVDIRKHVIRRPALSCAVAFVAGLVLGIRGWRQRVQRGPSEVGGSDMEIFSRPRMTERNSMRAFLVSTLLGVAGDTLRAGIVASQSRRARG